jgi:hypothetical protein
MPWSFPVLGARGGTEIAVCAVPCRALGSVPLTGPAAADHALQHDVDVRPFRQLFEIPLIGHARLPADPALASRADAAAQAFANTDLPELPAATALYNIRGGGEPTPVVCVRGTVVSGDQFVSSVEKKAWLLRHVPDALCCEMEGAAVAQVCLSLCLCLCVCVAVWVGVSGSVPGRLWSSEPQSVRIHIQSIPLTLAPGVPRVLGPICADAHRVGQRGGRRAGRLRGVPQGLSRPCTFTRWPHPYAHAQSVAGEFCRGVVRRFICPDGFAPEPTTGQII